MVQWFTSYDEKKFESCGYMNNKYHHQELLFVEDNLFEPTYHRLTYHEVYDEQVNPRPEQVIFPVVLFYCLTLQCTMKENSQISRTIIVKWIRTQNIQED